MFRNFVNIFSVINPKTEINFDLLVKKRMYILESQGYDISSIDWDLYTKILKMKFEKFKVEQLTNISTYIITNS